jgi:hypothetical protein
MLYDVFICHAGEDKDDFVRPLARRLKRKHIEVWYDEFCLKPGDSIRRAIDIGLSKSRYGIVVLSKNFFNKGWPQWELDGLAQRQNTEKNNIIIPIWYKVTYNDVLSYSAPLANIKAILTDKGLNYVISELVGVIKPEGSTLLIARERILELGYEPPVVTDDWWLDAAEFSGSNYYWERWGFPLPNGGTTPSERGERLAWAALQMMWQDVVDDAETSQITHPQEVLQFIESQPGLSIACHQYPDYLAAYAPQLTIKGFGGEFEKDFETLYKRSVFRHKKSLGGTGLTVNGSPPLCDERWALRHPTFGNYEPSRITCNFIQGELMGLTVRVYECIDYIVWFLSSQSSWIPRKIHKYLLKGFKEWPVWAWPSRGAQGKIVAPDISTGALFSAMYDAKTFDKFKITKDCVNDIESRFNYTIKLLSLTDTADTLAQRFINSGFIEAWFKIEAPRLTS